MDEFVISCPSCRKDSHFSVDSLRRIAIPRAHISQHPQVRLGEVVTGFGASVLRCMNPDCWAPFQAVICRGTDTAEKVQQIAASEAWSPPRRFRLPQMTEGEYHDDYYGVLFHRDPLTRWKEIRLSSLMDISMVAKFLSAHAWRFGRPVTLFEAWASEVDKSVHWIPVQPLGPPRQPQEPLEIGTAPGYRETCRKCREVFEAGALRELERLGANHELGKNCEYRDDCPAKRACEREPWESPNVSDRCLRWLRLRKQDQGNVCWQSDLRILDALASRFEKREITPPRSFHESPCWVGYQENAFPIVVHNHLAGAVILGQWDVPGAPETADDFVARERAWLTSAHSKAPSLLVGSEAALEEAIRKDRQWPRERTEEQYRDICQDVETLAELLEDRYQRCQDLKEDAFRQEIRARLTTGLLRGDDFADILPQVLRRMRDFWAFQYVCACVMAGWEAGPTLYATDRMSFPNPKPTLAVSDFPKMLSECGGRNILLDTRSRNDDSQLQPWWDFLDLLRASWTEAKETAKAKTLVVVARAGPRSYAFCFAGRDGSGLSVLKHNLGPIVELSQELRDQVTRTCEAVAEGLHGYWVRYDQESAYRALSHWLRTPIVRMKRGMGLLRRQLNLHHQALQNQYPQLVESAQDLLESLRIGSSIVDGDLNSLGGAANLQKYLEMAKRQTTDLAALLWELEPQCRWRSRIKSQVGSEIGRPPPSWDFRVAGPAPVCGEKDVIALAVRNVLENAIKYSYSGRCIGVELAGIRDGWRLVVTSRGVPVEEDELDRVWQRDYRGVNAQRRIAVAEEGTGYGLFLVKQIVEAQGGCVFMRTKLLPNAQPREGETTVELVFARPKED